MTRVIKQNEENYFVCCKGAPETVLSLCKLDNSEQIKLLNTVQELAEKGQRILGVAKSNWHNSSFPESQKDYEKLAIQLASNHEKLDLIKQKMRNIKETPLFDIRTFTKNIEAEYLKIYQYKI